MSLIRVNLVDLPVSLSLSNFWCFGFVLGYLIRIQIISGIVLSFNYVPDPLQAFFVVNGIMTDEFIG